MIEVKGLTKKFKDHVVLDNVDITITDNSIFGLVGINGAGKSTLMRILARVYKYDSGSITIDGVDLNSKEALGKVFYLPDTVYASASETPYSLAKDYADFYDNFNFDLFHVYLNKFNIGLTQSLGSFSKGMKRRAYISIALAAGAKYVLLDEAFDGLDPIGRIEFKNAIAKIIDEENVTFVLASHALKDLEDIADSFVILDNKDVLDQGKISDTVDKIVKYQLAYNEPKTKEIFESLNPIDFESSGRIVTVVFKVNPNINYDEEISKTNPLIMERVDVNFEEYFTTIAKEAIK